MTNVFDFSGTKTKGPGLDANIFPGSKPVDARADRERKIYMTAYKAGYNKCIEDLKEMSVDDINEMINDK